MIQGDWFQTHCAYCQNELPKNIFGKHKHSRSMPFGAYACSGRCQIALCDELDNVDGSDSEQYAQKIKNRWKEMPSLPRSEYIRECKQRKIKP